MAPDSPLRDLKAYYMDGPYEDSAQIELGGGSMRYNARTCALVDEAFCEGAKEWHERLKREGKVPQVEVFELEKVTEPRHGLRGYIGGTWLIDFVKGTFEEPRNVRRLHRRLMSISAEREAARRINQAETITLKPGFLNIPKDGEIDHSDAVLVAGWVKAVLGLAGLDQPVCTADNVVE